jgi:choline kinase
MRAIIIAAGRGSRLGKITDNIPKPLVEVNGESILGRQISLFNQLGINDIVVITGYKREKIIFKDINYVVNDLYSTTEQLFSLMKARSFFSGDLIVCYGDIIYDQEILNQMISKKGDLVLAVDQNWKQSYAMRPDNPAIFSDFVNIKNNKINKFFTNLEQESFDNDHVVEFIGMMKLSSNGTKAFLTQYLEIEKVTEKLKIIGFLEKLRRSGVNMSTYFVEHKWCEIDTPQDLEIAKVLFA